VNSSGFLLIGAAAVCTAISNLSLRYGIRHIGGFSVAAFVTDPACMAGLLFQAVAALIWFRILAVMEVNRGYPVLVSLTFLLVVAGSVMLFGESMSWRKLTGLAVILSGIWLAVQG
jgi:multidrug transporter EmrE-like cation transporter